MNYLNSAHSCRLCRRWLEGEAARADPLERAELERQMDNGMCDACQRKRWAAAVELIAAQDGMRLFASAGYLARMPGLFAALKQRLVTAEARCVALKMWHPRETIPERFRDRGKETA